ncbi:MAG: serine/threonine protein kinase [Sphingomonadales bacterium]|nr:serine/threonine protein kinase [Sphingomonadales bacterium]
MSSVDDDEALRTRRRLVLSVFETVLDQPDGNQMAWLDAKYGDDEALVREVEALLAADQRSADILPTLPNLPPRPRPERVGPYRLTETLGSGGMGDVYLGERDDGLFDHKVAVKIMRQSRLEQESALLFDTERRALARLRHRHIARLFDGGLSDGAPYFIMELIEGHWIDAYIRDHALDARSIVSLVADVCDAVQYAHEQLVVHGDIKPSNILIEPGGFPKLVDFGIGQILTGTALVEEAGLFPSTPAFASPERRRGMRPKPADDIYSLGILLTVLLESRETAADKDLTAIVAKARAALPDRRYTTVAALREDLLRWTENRPVMANPTGLRHRAQLFVRRNRLLVTAGSTIAAMLLASLVVIATLYVRAEASRADAERRFAEVRGLARYMLGDFHDALETLPGSSRLRALTADVGRDYLERLSRGGIEDPDLQAELAAGYATVGHALAINSTNATGDISGGEAALSKAETLLRRLIADRPTDNRAKVELARVLTWRSGVYLAAHGDQKAANLALDESFRLYDQVLTVDPANLAAAYGRWNTTLGRADVLQVAGQWNDAIKLMEDNRRRAARLPVTPQYAGIRALYEAADENNLGDAYYYSNAGIDKALPHYQRAVAILAEADRSLPPDVRRQIRSVFYHYQVAGTFQEMERLDKALDWAARGTAMADALVRIDQSPAALHARNTIALTHATILSNLGRHDEAVAAVRHNIADRHALAAANPKDLDLRLAAASGYGTLIEILDAAGRGKEACAAAQRAWAEWIALDRRGTVPQMYRDKVMPKIAERKKSCP